MLSPYLQTLQFTLSRAVWSHWHLWHPQDVLTFAPQPRTFHPKFGELLDWHLHLHYGKFKINFFRINWNTGRQNLGKVFVKSIWFSTPWTEFLASLCSSLATGFWNYHLSLSLTALGMSPELKIPNPGVWTNIIENHFPNITQDSVFPAEKGFNSVINNK